MTAFIWFGYLGAWLLFAGPIWQAAVELREEGFDEEEQTHFRDRVHDIPPPPRVSGWWWLLPPVAYVKTTRINREWRHSLLITMPKETRSRFLGFQNKATGWLIVAGGALAIGLKETSELIEHLEWPLWALAPAIIVPFFLSVWHTAGRMARIRRLEREAEEADASAS